MGVGRRAAVGELVHIGLAEEHRTRRAQTAYTLGIGLGHPVFVDSTCGARQHSRRVDVVLERYRYTMQRPARVPGCEFRVAHFGFRHRRLGSNRDEGVNSWFNALDAVEVGSRQRCGRKCARRDTTSTLSDRELNQLIALCAGSYTGEQRAGCQSPQHYPARKSCISHRILALAETVRA